MKSIALTLMVVACAMAAGATSASAKTSRSTVAARITHWQQVRTHAAYVVECYEHRYCARLLHKPDTKAWAKRVFRHHVRTLRRAESKLAWLRSQQYPPLDSCLSRLIQRESGWDGVLAHLAWYTRTANSQGSGAYGLGQALPASKMKPFGSDYMTNPWTQIRWMRSYVGRYGGSCGALAFQIAHNWY